MGPLDDTPSVAAGWYPDPSRPNTERYWDGAAWTQHWRPMAIGVPPSPPQRKRRRALWITLAVVAVIAVCGCPILSFTGLARLGLSSMQRTQTLVQSAPADGSSVTTTLTIGGATNVSNRMSVVLSPLNNANPAEMYGVRLEPAYTYEIDGQPSDINGFFVAVKASGPKECALTYSRSGIQKLALIR